MLIDTHAHVNFRDFKDDGDRVIKKALDQEIWLINIGSEYKTSQRAIEYANKYKEGVYAAVGLHPIHLQDKIIKEEIKGEKIEIKSKKEEFNSVGYMELAEDKKVVAIGETGLDYSDVILNPASYCHSALDAESSVLDSRFRGNDKKNNGNDIKAKQKEVFKQQLELAQQLQKPVIFHCRKAYDDLIAILEEFNSGCLSCPFACPGAGGGKLEGVVHCFMGRWSHAEKLLNMGFYFGFNGLITYARDYDKVIEKLPLERILLETDCPYLTPKPFRGQRNEPSYVKYVAEKIAAIKKIKLEVVAEQTTKNAQQLFKI